ncbi:MAG: hypothetical protein JXA57_17745 [Armatimonadetes bacterium]|nr:hypothetical protein [Armatimonadota bacterium]
MEEGQTEEVTREKKGAGIYTAAMVVCILGAIICLVLSQVQVETIMEQIYFLALGAVLGILGRIAQAAKHREEDK